MSNGSLHHWIRASALGLIATVSAACWAQSAPYPSNTIHMIAASSPGGGVDYLSRESAKILADGLGVSAIVENRPGGNGVVGKDLVAKARPDGYTLLMGSSSLPLDRMLHPGYPFDISDFVPVIYVGFIPLVLVANPAFPVKDVKELISMAKAQPDKISFATGGTGAGAHLSGEMFQYLTGAKLLNVPYKGNAPALVDVLAGHVNIMWDTMNTSLPHLRAGKLKALAVTSPKRSAVTPEYPTMIEAGLPGFEISAWYMIFAPKGTPTDVLQKLNTTLAKAFANPDFSKRMSAQGIEVVGGSIADAQAVLKGEIERWAPIVKAANIKGD